MCMILNRSQGYWKWSMLNRGLHFTIQNAWSPFFKGYRQEIEMLANTIDSHQK